MKDIHVVVRSDEGGHIFIVAIVVVLTEFSYVTLTKQDVECRIGQGKTSSRPLAPDSGGLVA